MLHILVGFESHRKDSSAESLYVGHDSSEVLETVNSNLSRFAVIRWYKGPAYSKRWVNGEALAGELAEAPEQALEQALEEALEEAPEQALVEAPAEESGGSRKKQK